MAIVLIIDDSEAVCLEISRIVAELGHRPVTAQSSLEGLRLARELHPSLTLVDVEMPTIDGFKLTSALKQGPRFMPVVILTSHADPDSRRRGHLAGADDFLVKPVAPFELALRIQAMLRIRQLTDALDAANRRLAELADTDALTGIANRRHFDATLAREVERAQRYRRPLAVAVCDLDHFKAVNDTHGHAAGDAILKAVAEALAGCVRNSDLVARVGGEEFGVIAPEVADGALVLCERIRHEVAALVVAHDERQLRCTISTGVVTWDGRSPATPAELFAQADECLYAAKAAGRNRVVLRAARETRAA
jgi:two-component system, cell cycle response regulator